MKQDPVVKRSYARLALKFSYIVTEVGKALIRPAAKRLQREFFFRYNLEPRHPYVISSSNRSWRPEDCPPPISTPNLSTRFPPTLRAFWQFHGLGSRCLLVSENSAVKKVMEAIYPQTAFGTTDYFPELQVGTTDFIWDVCMRPSEDLRNQQFSSVIANSLLEHVIDPACAMMHMVSLLAPGGYFYGVTHTPSFPLHRYPRDYVRFHHDFFEDFPLFVKTRCGLVIELAELYSSSAYVTFCYVRSA